MDREEAQRRYPGATAYEPSREVRDLPESPAEVALLRVGRDGPTTTIGMASLKGGVKAPSTACERAVDNRSAGQ